MSTDSLVKLQQVFGGVAPGEELGTVEADFALLLVERRIGLKTQHHVAYLIAALGGDEDSVGTANFRHRRRVAGDDGDAAGHAFEQGDAETLAERGVEESEGVTIYIR